MRLFEQTGENTYMFGFEESYGCLVGTHARDKDGIAAVMALCEAAAYYKTKGYTLWDQMMNIYEKYGYYKELTVSVTKEGVSGADEIKQIMENIRQNPITQLGKYKVLKFRDYKQGTIKDLETGSVENTNLPTSNVLYFDLNNDAWCCVRPSGTEPKIKFYIGIKRKKIWKMQKKSLKELAEKSKNIGTIKNNGRRNPSHYFFSCFATSFQPLILFRLIAPIILSFNIWIFYRKRNN